MTSDDDGVSNRSVEVQTTATNGWSTSIGAAMENACVYGQHFQQTGDQPGMVANPVRGQLNGENGIFPVPVRA